MEFNSFAFIYFFILVFAGYMVLNHRWQNWLLLAASYFFYGFWDARFLALLVISTLIDYLCARKIAVSEAPVRQRYLYLSLAANLSILGFFKYYNFFIDSFAGLATAFGMHVDPMHLALILPVGISFYTFQTMSYTIDVYRRKIPACNRLDDFALFISFFPQLVAGPIERAGALLPQVSAKRSIDFQKLSEGFWLLLYGFFQKIVIADNLAPFISLYRNDVGKLSGGELAVGFYIMVFFLYADFSGYSNIARGSARLLGFEISQNFKMPMFAHNPADFWRRWHVTLSDWFRDYCFQPMINRMPKKSRTPLAMAGAAFATLLLCGLWHGAAWNFVAFGAAHGILLVGYYRLRPLIRKPAYKKLIAAGPGHWIGRVLMFHLLSLPVVFFMIPKANDWRQFFRGIIFGSWDKSALNALTTLVVFGLPLLIIDVLQEYKKDIFAVRNLSVAVRTICYGVLFALIVLSGATKTNEFVYFQF